MIDFLATSFDSKLEKKHGEPSTKLSKTKLSMLYAFYERFKLSSFTKNFTNPIWYLQFCSTFLMFSHENVYEILFKLHNISVDCVAKTKPLCYPYDAHINGNCCDLSSPDSSIANCFRK